MKTGRSVGCWSLLSNSVYEIDLNEKKNQRMVSIFLWFLYIWEKWSDQTGRVGDAPCNKISYDNCYIFDAMNNWEMNKVKKKGNDSFAWKRNDIWGPELFCM